MAVQVTGFFQNPQSGLIYESPLLTLVPHLQYAGQIALDVLIIGAGGPTGAVGYQSIDKSTLTYDASITDAYSQLIDALGIERGRNIDEGLDLTSWASAEPCVTKPHNFKPVSIMSSKNAASLVLFPKQLKEDHVRMNGS
jgi:hypothetical protein